MADGSSLVVQILAATGFGSALLAGLQAVVSRRQSRAQVAATEASADLSEAQAEGATAAGAKTIVEGATLLLQPMQVQIADLLAQVTELRRAVHEGELLGRRTAALLEAHARWDAHVVRRLTEAGIDVAPPPPLHLDDVDLT